MTERDIAGDVAFLVDQYKKLNVSSPGRSVRETQSLEIACLATAVRLATTVLVDLHRCADALESIARTQADMLNRQIQVG